MHKHVCYKPARYTSSVILYGLLLAFFVPGIWRVSLHSCLLLFESLFLSITDLCFLYLQQNPLVYLTGIAFVPLNFYQIGILAGGIATLAKKVAKVDMRGRILEISVVLDTLIMSYISWGLIKGFFITQSECVGLMLTNGSDQNVEQNFASNPQLGNFAKCEKGIEFI